MQSLTLSLSLYAAVEPKDASSYTKKKNEQVLKELPFSDTQDFTDAKKGFIATTPDLVIKDENADTEKDALDNYESEIEETSIIGYLSKLVEKGYDRNACLEKTANAFGIDKETMLEVIKEELLRRGKVKQTDKGDYYIGD